MQQNDKYEEVKEALNVGDYNMIVTPKELRGESLEELYKMQQCFVDYQGNYLIDTYTKRKK